MVNTPFPPASIPNRAICHNLLPLSGVMWFSGAASSFSTYSGRKQPSSARPLHDRSTSRTNSRYLPRRYFKAGDGGIALFPVNDLPGDQPFGRFFQNGFTASGQFDFRRHGGGELHQLVIQKGNPGLQTPAVVMLSTRLRGSSTSITVMSIRRALSTRVGGPGQAEMVVDKLRDQFSPRYSGPSLQDLR